MAKPTPPPPPQLEGAAINPIEGGDELQAAPITDVPHARSGLLRSPWVQDVLPLATSILLHIGVILIGYGTYKVAEKVVQVVKEQVIIPDSTMVDGAEAGGIPNPGLGGDPTRRAEQDSDPNVKESDGWAEKPSASLEASLMAGGATDGVDGTIGIGGATSFGKGDGKRVGSGTGDGGGAMAPFGVPGGGGGIGPKSNFMGVGGNARTVAFICDASGSMMGKMSALKVELKKAIDGLKPVQGFSVIFFKQDNCSALSQQLLMGNPDNKRKAYAFLEDTYTEGATNPIPGLELAFKQKPQLIYLLTDGDFPDNDAVLKKIRELNSAKGTKINTIAFVSKGDKDTNFIDLLKQIATENGGLFKHVTEDDLNN